jgi:hypothetical protein
MELNERLKQVIEQNSVSQKRIALDLDVSPATVSGWLASGPAQCGEAHLTKIVNISLEKLSSEEKEALLAELFHLRLRARIVHDDAKSENKWTPKLRAFAMAALDRLRVGYSAPAVGRLSQGRTLTHFPDAFYPLTVISGDKREESESRINLADFGVASASPAETRWIARLQLRPDVEFLTDKVFVLEDFEQLRQRFAQRNLLVVGSPGSNHLARRIHLAKPVDRWRKSTPIFRFNVYQQTLTEIEGLLERLKPKHRRELVGEMGNEQNERHLKYWLKYLFGGGIIDPSGDEFTVRGHSLVPNLDFGLISLARNPFSDDDRFVAILAAGFHMFGTAHAIRMLSEPKNFAQHPFGGVVRVSVEGEGFAERFDQSVANWDTESDYSKDKLLEGLERLAKRVPEVVSVDQSTFRETIDFVRAL